ncbi:MAG: T9SS type A sorting domain-containing protein [Flavobacteriaceae bacterium]|nr:MAG: T9SS type A sorting domain-containing protein [Flavobacteriaceae bacterium]
MKNSNFHLRSLIILIFVFIVFGSTKAQTTPESCSCRLDTLGLRSYLNTLTLSENTPLRFEVQSPTSTFAVLHGTIGSTTPTVTQTFIDTYPNVTTLVMMQIPGSNDDTANLDAALRLRNRGYTTYLPAVNAYPQDAFIASGGTDMILSGTRRVIDVGAEVGVHSWSNGTNSATDFPVGHANHQPYINYYIAMGFSTADAEAFYYFTINAAPANSIHNMTETEIEQYKLRTCTYSASPTYMATLATNVLTANLAGATYQWLDCDNGNAPISGATNQSFTPTSNGNYAVQVTEADCIGTSTCYSVTTLGVSDIEFDNSISLYPNPGATKFFVDLKAINENTTVRIRSITGKTIEKRTSMGNEQITFDNHNYSKGIYLVTVTTNSRQKTMKLIIK